MKTRTEVLVIGGGPVGACSAYALAAAGADVTLVERETDVCPPVSGAHANCGLILPSHLTPLAAPGVLSQGLRWLLDASSPFYVAPRLSPSLARWLWLFRAACTEERAQASMPVIRALNVRTAELHDELGREHGERWLYHQNGMVEVYETAAGATSALAEAAHDRGLGVRSRELTPTQVRERFPGLRCDMQGAVFFDEASHLDPTLFTRAMAGLAAAAGAEVVTGAEALALEPAGGGAVRAVTTRGDTVAGQVVLAAGAWTPALLRGLGLHLPIEPAKGYSVDVARPADFPEVPFYLGEAHVVMTPLGGSLRLGGTLELAGWDTTVHRRRVAGLRRGAERAFGIAADDSVERIWRGPRPVSPDGLPVIGRLRRQQNVIVATGHCMMGLTMGPVTGQLVAELAGGALPSIDLAPLSPQRFA
ncbi:MAG: FAD-dependent oxidoreductase [Thermoleophilia bacterium]